MSKLFFEVNARRASQVIYYKDGLTLRQWRRLERRDFYDGKRKKYTTGNRPRKIDLCQ